MNKGEIWLVELPSANGHEQVGNRPVILVADTESNISIIIPFTSNLNAKRFLHTLEIKPTEENGLVSTSVALIFHVRVIDKKRFNKKIGDLDSLNLQKINDILKNLLKIN